LAIARKEFRHVTRDARTLFLVTIAPAILLVALAYVFSFDANHAGVVVLDQDQSDLSRQYIADLTSDGTFQVMAYLEHYDEIDIWMKSGRARLALVIPPGTAATLQALRPASVQAILDGVDMIGAAQALGQLNARTNVFSYKLLPSVSVRTPGLLDVRTRVWYNPSQKSMNSMVPGLMAVVLYMPALALSLSLTREKELGSFEGLAATPIHGLEYLLGKTITYLGFGLVSLLPVVLVATLWFHVPFQGSLWVFLVLSACYFLASFGLSHFVSSLVGSQQTAMMIMLMVFFVPSFFLAGLVLPVDTSSPGSQVAAYSLPVTHFIFICRSVFLKGLGLAGLIEPMLALLAIAGLSATVSLRLFCKWIG